MLFSAVMASTTGFVSVPTHRGAGSDFNAQDGPAEVGGRVEDLARGSKPNQTPTYASSNANTPIGFTNPRQFRGEGATRPLPELFGQPGGDVDSVPLLPDAHRRQSSAGVQGSGQPTRAARHRSPRSCARKLMRATSPLNSVIAFPSRSCLGLVNPIGVFALELA